ncbi:MAG TPA: hypothetical protein VGT03_03075 [Candidatus Acidoferrales bacterium]|nr:hypothetical protein [Candidatus Acidoferrales bacterium]
MTKDLAKTKDDLIRAAEKEGVVIFFGAYPSEGVHEINWNTQLKDDPSTFVKVAKQMGARTLYLNWIVFSQEELEDAKFEESEEDGVLSDSELEYNSSLTEFNRYLGAMASVRAGFFADGIFHIFEQETEWYEEFGELVAEAEDENADGGLEREREVELSPESLSWAEKLAHHPSFRKATGWAQRKYLLKKLAGEEIEKLPVADVISHAESIYEVDVRPVEEGHLAEQVLEMRKAGKSIVAIAGKLDIPRGQVERLLGKLEN